MSPGQEPDGKPRLDVAHVCLQVGRLKTNVGFESRGSARLLRKVPGSSSLGLHHPRGARHLVQLGHRGPGAANAQANLVAGERSSVYPLVVRCGVMWVLLGNHDVEGARPRVRQGCPWLGLSHANAKSGVSGRESDERCRHERERGGLEHGEPDGPVEGPGARPEFSLGDLEGRQDGIRARHEAFARRRETQFPPRPDGESHAGLALESRQLLGDRGRGVAHGLRRRRNGPASRELAEHPEPCEVEHSLS